MPHGASLRILNATLVLPDRLVSDGALHVEDGRLTAVGDRGALPAWAGATIDAAGHFVAPGFVDLHVHGGDHADFMDGTIEAFETAIRAHTRHGVTSIVPTSTVAYHEQTLAFLRHTQTMRQRGAEPRRGLARTLGAHLYGPFFAEDKVGCHPKLPARPPVAAEYGQYLEFDGIVLTATCAPELPGAADFYRAAAARRVRLNAGHSNATWAEMAMAHALGVRHVDHFYCAMSSVASLRDRCGTPMQASMMEFVLDHEDMTTEVIADGRHLSPELLRFVVKWKGASRTALVTDCSRALDCPPGLYTFAKPGEQRARDGLHGAPHAPGGRTRSADRHPDGLADAGRDPRAGARDRQSRGGQAGRPGRARRGAHGPPCVRRRRAGRRGLNRHQLWRTDMDRRAFVLGTAAAAIAAARPLASPAAAVELGSIDGSVSGNQFTTAQFLDYLASIKLTWAMISLPPAVLDDEAEVRRIRDHAGRLGIRVQLAHGSVCPSSRSFNAALGTLEEQVARSLRASRIFGASCMRCILGGDPERPDIDRHIENMIAAVRSVRSRILDSGVKLAVENHGGDLQARELKMMIEAVGRDVIGVCLDSGNPVWMLEDPHMTLETLIPYAETTGTSTSTAGSGSSSGPSLACRLFSRTSSPAIRVSTASTTRHSGTTGGGCRPRSSGASWRSPIPARRSRRCRVRRERPRAGRRSTTSKRPSATPATCCGESEP